MNRILIAAAATLALSGAAFAQPASLSGNYSANVLQQYSTEKAPVAGGTQLDLDATASIPPASKQFAPAENGTTAPSNAQTNYNY